MKIIIILAILLSSFTLSGKNIKDYFLIIPGIKTYNGKILDKKAKKSILNNKNNDYRSVFIDIKNAYMRYTSNTDVEGTTTEITYYNLKNKKKLIIVNNISWGMSHEISDNYFLYYAKGKHIKRVGASDILPKWDIRNFIIDKKKKKKVYDLLKKRGGENFYLLKLPQKGKNIVVSIDWWILLYDFESSSNPKDKKIYKELSSLSTKNLTLKFKNGRFYK